MAEKQTVEEFHFKTDEIINALRAAGYELPGSLGNCGSHTKRNGGVER